MKKTLPFLFIVTALLFATEACDYTPNRSNIIAASRNVIDTGRRYIVVQRDTSHPTPVEKPDSVPTFKPDSVVVAKKTDTPIVTPKPIEKTVVSVASKADSLVNYAKSLVGKPYEYGANTPDKGFDNSGFVNFIFGRFGIKVPKYAPAFIAAGEKIAPSDADKGDIVLFAKTDSVKKVVYQVGIVVSAKGSPVSFIHASGGKTNGVGITNLTAYYQRKLMGFRRVF